MVYTKGSHVIISIKYCISLKINIVLANSVDFLHIEPFHLGLHSLHCLPKYTFKRLTSIKRAKT